MAKAKTFRLDSDTVTWLATTARECGLSEQKVMEALIGHARQHDWKPVVRVDVGGWISGPSTSE